MIFAGWPERIWLGSEAQIWIEVNFGTSLLSSDELFVNVKNYLDL